MRSSLRRAAVVLCATLCGAGLGATQEHRPPAHPNPEPAAGVRLEHFRWSKDVGGESPIRALEVVNDYGDIRARLADEPTIEATAVIQRLDPGPQGVGVTVERRGDVVALTVGYPAGRQQDADPEPPKDRMDRLDLTVFVPASVALGARTIRGMVEVRGFAGDVSAATNAGNISVATSGGVQARTASGQVSVSLRPGQATRPLVLQSLSGGLRLTVPRSADLEVRAETGGAASSDFPLERLKRGDRTRLSGALGHGTRDVLLYSETGPVEVLAAQ
jgi:hypothetical protein